MNIEIIAIVLGAPVLSFLSGLLGAYVERQKRNIEVKGMKEKVKTSEIQNDFVAYSGYQSISKDYAELADVMSEKFVKVKKELTLLKVKYNEELTQLNSTILSLKDELDGKIKEIDRLTNLLDQKSNIMIEFQSDCENKLIELEEKMQEYINELDKIKNNE